MTFDDVRALALALPGVEEATSYGTPAFKVGGKLIARLRPEGDSLVVFVSFDEREMLMQAEPATFYITDHYRAWPSMLVRLACVHPGTLSRLLEQTWSARAPRRLVKARQAGRG